MSENPTAGPSVDLIIAGGDVVTMDEQRSVNTATDVGVEGGRIVAIEPSGQLRRLHPNAEVLDAGGCLVLPGLVDGHLHLGLTVMGITMHGSTGFPPPSKNSEFAHGGDVTAVSFQGALPADSIARAEITEISATYTAMLAMKAGATTVVDGGGGDPDAIATATSRLGMRCVVAPGVGDVYPDGSGGIVRNRSVERITESVRDFRDRWRDHPLVDADCWNLLVATSASDALLDEVAADEATRVICHIAALANEYASSHEHFGVGSVERFDRRGLLSRLLAIHAGCINDDEIERFLAEGTTIAHCPRAATISAGGYFGLGQVTRFIREGGRTLIGTDVPQNGHLLRSMADAATMHRDVTMDQTEFDAPEVLAAATCEAARILGTSHQAGSIELGHVADLTVVDITDARYQGPWNPLRRVIEWGSGEDVRHVVTDGQVSVRDHRLVACDEDDVVAELTSLLDRQLEVVR